MNNYSFIYFSPHLDDAVLSCGGFMRKNYKEPQLIINIFSKEYKGLTRWDLSCEIKKDPMSLRKKESQEALKLVIANEIYLDFFENAVFRDLKKIKRPSSDVSRIKNKILKIVNENFSSLKGVFFPLGISHPDHFIIAKIGRSMANKLKPDKLKIYFYEDFPYFYKSKEHFLKISKKFTPIYFKISNEIFAKFKAIITYKSQLFSLLQIIHPQIKRKRNIKRPWKEFLFEYHKKLAKESKLKNAKFCERFWEFKN